MTGEQTSKATPAHFVWGGKVTFGTVYSTAMAVYDETNQKVILGALEWNVDFTKEDAIAFANAILATTK